MAAATPARTHRLQRIAGGVALGLTIFSTVVSIATAVAWRYAGSAAGRTRLGALAQDRLVEMIPGLRIHELGRDRGGTLSAAGIDIWDSDGRRAVHVDHVRVTPRWSALIRRQIWIEEVRLEGVRVLGRPEGGVGTKAGPLNLTKLVSSPRDRQAAAPRSSTAPTGDHLPVSVRVDRVVVSDGAADVVAGEESPHLIVHRLDLQAGFDSADLRTTAALHRLSASGAVDGHAFTAILAAHGQWLTERSRELDVQLDQLRITGLTPAGEVGLRAAATGDLGALRIWWVGTGPEGATTTAAGTIALGELGLERYDLRMSADVPALSALVATAPAGSVALRAHARGEGMPLDPGSNAQLNLYIPPASLAGHSWDGVDVEASSVGPSWRLERADLHAPGVSVHADGTGDGPRLKARAKVDIRNVASARRNAGLRAGAAPALPARGAGHLVATVDGRLDEKMTFELDGRARALRSTAWGRLASLDVSLRGTAERREESELGWLIAARGHGRVAGLDGPAVALAAARFKAAATTTGQGTDGLQVGSVVLAARGLRVGSAAFTQMDLQARADRTVLSLSARATGRSGTAVVAAHGTRRRDQLDVSLDRLELALAAPGPRQHLTLLRPASLTVRAGQEIRVANLEVRASGELLAGQAALSAMARLERPTAGGPWAQADVTLTGLTTAGIPPVTGTVTARADGKRALADIALRMGPSSFTGNLDLPAPIRASLSELRLSRQGRMAVALDSKDLDLASLPPLQKMLSRHGLVGGRITTHVTVTGDIAQPDARVALDVRALELRDVTGKGRDAVIHTIPGIGGSIQLETAPGQLKAAGKILMYGAGVATFGGRLDVGLGTLIAGNVVDIRKVPLAARVDVPRFQINALKSLSDELRETRGWLSGGAVVTGTLAHPVGKAQLAISDVQVDGLSVGRVAINASTDGRDLRGEARIQGSAAGTLEATGHMSLGASPNVTARLQAKALNPGVIRPFLSGVRELSGVVDADIRITGAPPALRFDGRLYAYRGRIGVVGQPTFHDAGLALSLRPGRVELDRLQMYSGGGSLEARGAVALDGLEPRSGVLTGQARRFVIAAAGMSGARLDGEWALEVARRDDVLGGRIDVPRAAVWLPKIALGGRRPQRIAPHDDVRFVDGASRAADARDRAASSDPGGDQPLTVDVQAKARTIYVRGKDLDLELESAVSLKTPQSGGPLQLLGSVRIRRGRINIQGQRFDVGTGTITFDGATGNPRIDLTLSHNYPDARVIVALRGRPNKPELRLTSEPAIYDQSQIVSLILTGQVQGRPGAGGSFDPTATIATAVMRKLADKVAPEVGLDVIRIERTKPTEAGTTTGGDFAGRVEVGKYINDRVYVSYAHRFGATERQNANEAHAEYRLSPHWLAETVFGDAGVGGVDAFWIYRY